MKFLNKKQIHEIKTFYMGDLLKTFDISSTNTMQVFFYKHLSEIDLILDNISKTSIDLKSLEILDVGGGLGINCIILKKIFGINSTVIDRLDEFDKKHNRATGNDTALKKRLNHFGVKIIESDFIKNNFNDLDKKFNCITCFSVIEHFSFSPKSFLNQLHRLCKKNALVLISTPNQLHLLNRFRALFGINIWENFDYYFHSDQYFGHVREFTADEMIRIATETQNLDLMTLDYSNFPIYSNNSMNYFKKNLALNILGYIFELFCLFNKKFKFHLTLILKTK